MAAVMLFLRQTTGKTERHTHFCIPLEPVFTRDCGGRVHFTDEPTGELDSATAMSVMGLFRELVEKEGVTIVMTTHDMGLIGAGDMVFELRDGMLVDGDSDKTETEDR